MTEIILTVYFAIGAFALYQAQRAMNNEEVLANSKTLQKISDIYRRNPQFVTVFLFVFVVILWLPTLIYLKLFSTEEGDDGELKKEAEMIKKIMKGES